ncbi:MAG: hypothetical protein EZS28_015983 [Streblomastix strix]|uniref:Uncharacterized protein n=1 Tax=Streblomastix strix TaxID=222440 RepID=A0A5J4W1G9_9EUKA|nr:MAG: hypothetical protein EZS28_015983 [Streblomastix strix]
MLRERVKRRYGPFRAIKQWRIEEVLHDWIPELDVRECAEGLAKIEQKTLSDLIRIVMQFMRKRRFHLLPNIIFCEICQCKPSFFCRVMKDETDKNSRKGKQSRPLTDDEEDEIISYLALKWHEGLPFEQADFPRIVHQLFRKDISRMFIYYFTQ